MPKNQKIMFKACIRGHSAFRSGSSGIEYTFGKLIKPHPSQNPFVFVFDTIKNAKKLCSLDSFELFEVLAFDVKKSAVTRKGHTVFAKNFPTGTNFCSSLYLLRKINK